MFVHNLQRNSCLNKISLIILFAYVKTDTSETFLFLPFLFDSLSYMFHNEGGLNLI